MAVSLVIMAAGLGSRYGGSKQVDGIGPNGEILMEYSIHDALRAGFDKVVFIIKPEMREMMDELVGYLRTIPPYRTSITFLRDAPSPSARSTPCCARSRRWTDPSASSTPMTITGWTLTAPSMRNW